MSKFPIHTVETAPEGSVRMLKGAQASFGFVPNLLGTLAGAPVALEAYTRFSALLAKSSLSELEVQVVLLSTSAVNSCEYCVAAHSTISDMKGLDASVVRSIRDHEAIAETKLEALRVFTQAVVENRGWLKDGQLEEFLAAGYGSAQAMEVMTAIAMKTISNYVNHLSETPVDEQFQARAWSAQAVGSGV